MRWPASCALTGLLAVGLLAVAPAAATASPVAPSMLSLGSLSITAPTTVDLGSITIGAASSISASLGTVTVNSSGVLSSWAASVTSTGFTNGTTTIPPGSITYTAGPASATGVSLIFPGVAGPLSATTPLTAQTATVSISLGTTTASWNPGIQVTLPASVTVGTYTATITHSVA
jgi:hypothetical protein